MAPTQFTAQVSEITRIGEKFLFVILELIEPHRLEFTAGQYVLLDVPGIAQKKAFSISSAPRLDHAIELLVELLPGGRTGLYLSSLKPGDQLKFMAPIGMFTMSEQVLAAETPLVFVATGSGLAPLRSMILDLLRTKGTTRPIMLYMGARFAENLFWLDYFDELKANFPNFSYHITLSKAPPEWTLCRGRVTDCLLVRDTPANGEYYVCGSTAMITDVMKVLENRGISGEHIHHEKFS